MKKFFYLILILLVLFMLSAYLFNFDIFAYKVINYFKNLTSSNFVIIQILSLIFYFILGISFAIGGYHSARKKERNVWVWTIACFLWNIWAYLLILCLPSKRSNERKRKTRENKKRTS